MANYGYLSLGTATTPADFEPSLRDGVVSCFGDRLEVTRTEHTDGGPRL